MGRFTVRDDPAVDGVIEADLERIARAVEAEVGPDLEGLVLVGGFGRGEGSVLVLAGRILPMNDYDLVVLGKSAREPMALQSLGDALAGELGMGHLDLLWLRRADLDRSGPTMFNIDMKAGSTVLRGRSDLLGPLPEFSSDSVPLDEALVLLANRLTCLLEAVREEDLCVSRPLGTARGLGMTYMASKVALASAEARLLLAGRYDSSYRERELRFASLPGAQREEVEFIREMTRFKLHPSFPVPFDPRVAWHRSLQFYLATILEVGSRLWGRPVRDGWEWEACYRRRAWVAARIAANWLLSRRKHRDWRDYWKMRAVHAAQLHLHLAVRETLEGRERLGRHACRARQLLAPLLPAGGPLETWEELRRAAILADDLFLHPHVRRGDFFLGPQFAEAVDPGGAL